MREDVVLHWIEEEGWWRIFIEIKCLLGAAENSTDFDLKKEKKMNSRLQFTKIYNYYFLDLCFSTGVHFINVLHVWFSYKILAPKITKLWDFLVPKFCTKIACIKCWWNWRQVGLGALFVCRPTFLILFKNLIQSTCMELISLN